MKQWRKYPFFFMIVISSLIYGGSQLLGAEKEQEPQNVFVSQVSKENAAMEGKKEIKTVQKTEKENVPQESAIPDMSPEEVVPATEAVEPTEIPVEMQTIPEKREFQRVEMDYLDDALFIGDSRTSTLYEYAGWENTDFFVKYGQMVWDVWENDMDGVTLEQMLTSKQYGKIYIMLGINELGVGTPESFAAQFGSVVEQVRQFQPNAVIFVESIMHVTQSKDAENTYINNQEINARNEKLKELADNQTVFYIDENEVMDEPGTGMLKEEYSFDGVHLQAKYIEVWREFLLDHGIK